MIAEWAFDVRKQWHTILQVICDHSKELDSTVWLNVRTLATQKMREAIYTNFIK